MFLFLKNIFLTLNSFLSSKNILLHCRNSLSPLASAELSSAYFLVVISKRGALDSWMYIVLGIASKGSHCKEKHACFSKHPWFVPPL